MLITLKKYSNLRFLDRLVSQMTNLEPGARPTAEEALALFEELVQKRSKMSLSWRLQPTDESLSVTLRQDAQIALHMCGQFLNSSPCMLLNDYVYRRDRFDLTLEVPGRPILYTAAAIAFGATMSRTVGRRSAIIGRICDIFRQHFTQR